MRHAALALALAVGLGIGAPTCVRAGERVDVTATDGVQLMAELSGTRGPGVVLTRGRGEDEQRGKSMAATIAARGFRVLRLDLRGHGESPGASDPAAAEREIEGGYRYLLGRKIRPVFLVGTGAAGAASVAVATRVPTAGVALVGTPPPDRALAAPVLSLVDDSDAALDSLVQWLSDPKRATSNSAASEAR